jgi:hypothetical protein
MSTHSMTPGVEFEQAIDRDVFQADLRSEIPEPSFPQRTEAQRWNRIGELYHIAPVHGERFRGIGVSSR